MNTELTLEYRDAANWGASETVILAGEMTPELFDRLKRTLSDDCFLIAYQVGLPTPSGRMGEFGAFPTENDHVWTTISEFMVGPDSVQDLLTDAEPTEEITLEEFVEKLEQISDWDVGAEMERLGIPE